MVQQARTDTAMSTDAHDPRQMRLEKERRRSDRYPLVIPIHLNWPGLGGQPHSAHAQGKEANLHGGLLEFVDAERYPAEGTEAELTNLVSGHKTKARVSAIRRSSTGALMGVAVELLPPTKSFGACPFS